MGYMESRVESFRFDHTNPKIIMSSNIAAFEKIIGISMELLGLAITIIECLFSHKNKSLTNMFSMTLFIVFLFIMGGWMIYMSYKRIQNIIKFRDYVAILQNDESGSIKRLSSLKNESYSDTLSNLRYFVDIGFFHNVVIDESSATIQFLERIRKYSSNGYVTVTCNGCKATKLLPKGTVVRCEFCGNILCTKEEK